MKNVLIAAIFSLAASGAVSAQAVTDLGGGFAYAPVGSGNCQILVDAKYNQPVLQPNPRADWKVVLIGTKKECPKDYNGYQSTRLVSGQADGYIYRGVFDSGRKIYIYRKLGSSFNFKMGPSVAK